MAPIATLNPYKRQEAETIAFSKGVKSEQTDETGVYISEIHTGDYIKVREVDFGNESPDAFAISAACSSLGGSLEVHLDKKDGELVAKIDVSKTGGWEKWKTFSAQMLKKVT